MRLPSRLSRLERQPRFVKDRPDIRLLWPDQLQPCTIHARCDVESSSGGHHLNVIHLSFAEDQK